MLAIKPVKTALISVYHKEGLEPLLNVLKAHQTIIYSTGGTYEYLKTQGIPVQSVESLTSYPSILGGRVKTLHPHVFGGILARRDLESDQQEMQQYGIQEIDMVVVDLYPFAQTVAGGGSESEIIEKIDIGGVSLLRAAAKNYKDVWVVPSQSAYTQTTELLENQGGSSLANRALAAAKAMGETAAYDTLIAQWLTQNAKQQESLPNPTPTISELIPALPLFHKSLRYGENPHQKGFFIGHLEAQVEQLHGKEVSYNNLLDIHAAFSLIGEFSNNALLTKPTVAIIKHGNPCGISVRTQLCQAYLDALSGDPVSAYGGVIVCNTPIDMDTANELHKLFIEVLIAPAYNPQALCLLKEKKNRIILQAKTFELAPYNLRSCLHGYLYQQQDTQIDLPEQYKVVTSQSPSITEMEDLHFANIVVKHCKSNAIVLAKNQQLLANGIGQTSRVDALRQAIDKARRFGFDLQGAVLASDAFFPFADCVEIAQNSGINTFIQPGGSVRDADSIQQCELKGGKMVLTGIRHFLH